MSHPGQDAFSHTPVCDVQSIRVCLDDKSSMQTFCGNISSNAAASGTRIQKIGRPFLEIRLDGLGVIRCRHDPDLQLCFSL